VRILCIIPPHVPSYFNAGHHLAIFETAAYLRKHVTTVDVTCVDGAALNLHWRRLCDILHKGFDLIAVMVDFDGIDPLRRFIRYARQLTPRARILVFGRLTYQVPRFFENYDVDAIVESGDPEDAIASFVTFLQDGTPKPLGMRWRADGGFEASAPGRWLAAEDWALPDVSEIPYEAYDRMYEHDLDKFCGIPQRRELVVPVARGCPVGCVYCDVPVREGKLDRWLTPARVVSYIATARQTRPFEYVSFYAPTFTLRRRWVVDLCAALAAVPARLPWKCTTTLFHLDPDLIGLMARSGCVRISVGLETFGQARPDVLPRIKRDVSEKFEAVSKACGDMKVELNCFVILGLPGDSPGGVAHTIERVMSSGARVRPTVYTPYQNLTPDIGEFELSTYNRQLFVDGEVTDDVAQFYYGLCYGNVSDQPTRVMEKITRLRQIG
jgi:anaerobic magnesium-protoporphyrin IX monomethyl ester cyclase